MKPTKTKVIFDGIVHLLPPVIMIATITFAFMKWDFLTKDIFLMKILIGFLMIILVILCLVGIVRLCFYIMTEVFG